MEHDHENKKYEHCPDLIRKHEELILSNKIIVEDFLARYDRDRIACNERYKEDREEARRWREHFDQKLTMIESFVIQMKPNYRAAMYFLGMITLSSMALIFKTVWSHISNVR